MVDKGIPTEEDHERKRTAIPGQEPQRKERRVIMEDEEIDFIAQEREFRYSGKSCEMIFHIDDVEEFRGNPEAFIVKQIKKGKTEVKWKDLKRTDQERMKKAMGIEIGQWLEEKVCEILDSETKNRIPGREIMKMRWILTWKEDKGNTDDRKAKARLVVLGFQDPMMGHEEIASPTLNKRSRMLLYQNAVNK